MRLHRDLTASTTENGTESNAMGDSDRERALSLLRWTAFALRPLTVHEITEAVLLTEGMDELPVDEMPDCVDQDYVDSMILELCGSPIEVRHVSSSESIEHPECIQQSEEDSVGFQEVHLSHFSVKEYLLKTFPGTGTLLCNEKLRVTNGTIHNTTLAKHCLRFISFPGAWESLKMSDNKRPTMHLCSMLLIPGISIAEMSKLLIRTYNRQSMLYSILGIRTGPL